MVKSRSRHICNLTTEELRKLEVLRQSWTVTRPLEKSIESPIIHTLTSITLGQQKLLEQ